jgi:hypothetical protein
MSVQCLGQVGAFSTGWNSVTHGVEVGVGVGVGSSWAEWLPA